MVIEGDLASFFLSTADLMSVIDQTGKILKFNFAFQSSLGYTTQDLNKQSFFYFVHPDDISDLNKKIELLKNATQSVEVESRFVCKNGNICCLSTTYTRVGQEIYTVGRNLTNLTYPSETKACKIAEEKLRTERALFETTLDQLPVAVVLAEAPSGKLVFANKKIEEIFRHPMVYSASVGDYSSWQGFHPDGRSYEAQEWPMARAIHSGQIVKQEEVGIIRGDGTRGLIRLSAAPVRDDSGKIIAGVTIVEDRTELVHLEEEHSRLLLSERAAQESSRLKTQFLANMSHEIRTPLNGVVGLANLLLRTNLSIEQKDYAETIVQSSDHLQSLVNDILDLSKIEANRLDMDVSEIDLYELMSSVYGSMKHIGDKRGISFVLKLLNEKSIRFRGDSTRIRQVLLNLIQNALKFTEIGKVEFRASFEKFDNEMVKIRFEVEDTGIGIGKEEVKTIFDPFTQANSSITRRFGGSGLGLSICNRLVQLMDGEIGVQSTVGKGSTFFVLLNVKEIQGSSIKHVEKKNLTEFNTVRTLDILVAEDNLTNQKVICHMLNYFGHRATFVSNGVEAIQEVKNKKFDVILMDCHMPTLDGFSAAKRIRTILKGNHQIPIVALTADVLKETKRKCVSVGMSGFVSKPIDHELLFSEIERVITKSNILRLTKKDQKKVDPNTVMDLRAIEKLNVLSKPGEVSFGIEIVTSFIEKAPQKMRDIENALEIGNLKTVFDIAHSLKSIAAAIGAVRVEKNAADLESAARKKRLKESVEIYKKLVSAFNLTNRYLAKMRQAAISKNNKLTV